MLRRGPGGEPGWRPGEYYPPPPPVNPGVGRKARALRVFCAGGQRRRATPGALETVRRGALGPEAGRKTPHRAFVQGRNAPALGTPADVVFFAGTTEIRPAVEVDGRLVGAGR